MTHASLFSGIGGAEIAAAWMGWANLFHCDINPYGLQVLRYWFPQSVEYNDITKTDFSEWRGRVDVLTGGFPCQPFSSAGQRRGAEDDRYLWPSMCRAVDEVQPRYVVGENVNGITTMVEQPKATCVGSKTNLFGESYDRYRTEWRFTLERVCEDLEQLGYSVQPMVIPALAVGAPHRRDRVWFIAKRTAPDPDGMGRQQRRATGGDSQSEREGDARSEHLGTVEGLGVCGAAADAPGIRLQGRGDTPQQPLSRQQPKGLRPRQVPPRPTFENFPSQPPLCGGDDGVSLGMADTPLHRGRQRQWVVEALKALGNAWCPQVAFEIFKAIKEDNQPTNKTNE